MKDSWKDTQEKAMDTNGRFMVRKGEDFDSAVYIKPRELSEYLKDGVYVRPCDILRLVDGEILNVTLGERIKKLGLERKRIRANESWCLVNQESYAALTCPARAKSMGKKNNDEESREKKNGDNIMIRRGENFDATVYIEPAELVEYLKHGVYMRPVEVKKRSRFHGNTVHKRILQLRLEAKRVSPNEVWYLVDSDVWGKLTGFDLAENEEVVSVDPSKVSDNEKVLNRDLSRLCSVEKDDILIKVPGGKYRLVSAKDLEHLTGEFYISAEHIARLSGLPQIEVHGLAKKSGLKRVLWYKVNAEHYHEFIGAGKERRYRKDRRVNEEERERGGV